MHISVITALLLHVVATTFGRDASQTIFASPFGGTRLIVITDFWQRTAHQKKNQA